MADPAAPARSQEINEFLVAQGQALRAADTPPTSLAEWKTRRAKLRAAMLTAMNAGEDTPCALTPRITGVLKRNGYRIEKVLFQSRPDVWVTANAYVGEGGGKRPAVLVVHGHWARARRDPVVQARCLGLMHLGFFVLAVDAFGAGERYTNPHPGAYHGALYGSTLWPVGRTLLGMQVYDNRRAVDYLRTRPEVDATRLGITGASGGGNQTMYAGALDERFAAVVPVCSVGSYPAYLRSACCVCEVLPGALQFTGEGDVLGLVAPRALLVVNATRDSFNFSVGEATKSVARAKDIFRLHGAEPKVQHAIFESVHAYNQAMRETMYGWMTKWLKNEGAGKPIPEPHHTIETWDGLACFAKGERPASFMTPPRFAAREARKLLARWQEMKLDQPRDWEDVARGLRSQLRKQIVGEFSSAPKPPAVHAKTAENDGLSLVLEPEAGLHLPVRVRQRPGARHKQPACLLLHLDGKAAAAKHPLSTALGERGWAVVTTDLRGTGTLQPPGDQIGGAPDHNSAEHALWIGRPLLGQWCLDVRALLDWMAQQPNHAKERLALIGIGQAGLVALTAGALFPGHVAGVAAIAPPVSLVTEEPYPAGTRMGLLAPGLLRIGDVPQLAAVLAPSRLVLAGGVSSAGNKLTLHQMEQAFNFTSAVYKSQKQEGRLRLLANDSPDPVLAALD